MRRRKRVIPTLLLAILSWGGLGYLVYKTSPQEELLLIAFFLLLFLGAFLTASLTFNNSRRGFLIALCLVALALLRFFKLFHPLYIILLLALIVTAEMYFLKR